MTEFELGPNALILLSLAVNGLLALWNFRLTQKCKHIESKIG